MVSRSPATAPFQPETECYAPGQLLRACMASRLPQPPPQPGLCLLRGWVPAYTPSPVLPWEGSWGERLFSGFTFSLTGCSAYELANLCLSWGVQKNGRPGLAYDRKENSTKLPLLAPFILPSDPFPFVCCT